MSYGCVPQPSDRRDYYRLELILVEVFALQRQALREARWVSLNERGAFTLNEAAAKLRIAVKGLETVSAHLLSRVRDQQERVA